MADVEIKGRVTVDTGTTTKSINEMNKSLADSKKALKDLAVGSDEYKKAQADIDRQTRELTSATTQSGGAFGKLKDTLNSTVPGFQGASQGAAGLGKQFWLLVANPIGLIIAGIVVVFTLLYNVFKSFDPVMDKIEQGFAAVSAVIDSLMSTVLSLVTGATSLKEAFTGLGGSIKKAAEEAIEFTKVQQDLDDLLIKSTVNQAKYNRQINELILQSKDRTKTEAERVKLIDKALGIEDKAFQERKKIADDEVKVAQGVIMKGKNLSKEQQKMLRDKGVDYAISLKNTTRVTDDEIKVLAGALAKQEDILNQSISLREKALNRKYALQDADLAKGEAAEEKAEANRKKADEKAIANRKAAAIKKDKDFNDNLNKEIQALKDQKTEEAGIEAAGLELKKLDLAERQIIYDRESAQASTLASLRKQADDDSIASEKAVVENKRAVFAETEGLISAAMAVFGRQTIAGKALAMAQALMNTYSGATDALRAKSALPSPFDVVAKIANVAAVIATVFKSVKAIAGIQVPGGGGGGGAPSMGGVSIPAPLTPQRSNTSLDSNSIQGIGNAAKGGVSRSFVLDSDITNNQERNARINRAARLG